jgi:hypothetical protein
VNVESLRQLARRRLPPEARHFLQRLVATKRAWTPRRRFRFASAPDHASASPYPFPVDRDNELERLGARFQPTKRLHDYLPYYWMHFRDIRFDVSRVLEIGVQSDRSIRMWEEFFPNATVYGLDIDPACRAFEGGRRRIFIGDQGNRDFLRHVASEAGGAFDIVIDDGSHRVEHQLVSFDTLFPLLTSHGIYVVEDTGGCVGDPGLATVRSLTRLVESVMYWPPGFRPEDWAHLTEFPREALWADRHVIGVACYRWLVFVMRGANPGDNKHLTPLARD